jgi:hypothetical protein
VILWLKNYTGENENGILRINFREAMVAGLVYKENLGHKHLRAYILISAGQTLGFEPQPFHKPNRWRYQPYVRRTQGLRRRFLPRSAFAFPIRWSKIVSVPATGPFSDLGKMLVVLGIVLVIAGAFLISGVKLPFRLGRLPGDIAYQGRHGGFYFPIVTCILLSVALTLVSWIISHFRR